MEARRNLEAIYKRRLDEVDKLRFEDQLHLQVLKQYIMLASPNGSSSIDITTVQKQIDLLKDEFTKKIADILRAARHGGNGIKEDIWKESLNIAKLQLDLLSFNPENALFSQIREVILTELHIQQDHVVLKDPPTTFFNADVDHLRKVCRALYIIFSTFALDVSVIVTHDAAAGLLSLEFMEKNNKFLLLKDTFNTSELVFNHRAPYNTRVDDNAALFFISKSLLQSVGSDIIMTNDKITVSVPGEIIQNGQHAIPESPIPAPEPAPVEQPVEPTPKAPAPPLPHTKPIEHTPIPAPSPPIVETPKPQPLPPPPSPPQPVKTLAGKTLNILMGEDDPISRKMFKMFWNKEGHNVFTASDGVEAFELFKKQKYSIIFLDIEMPFKTGIETARDIRAYEKDNNLPPTPIIGVSGRTTKQYQEQALSSGMNEFISKGQGYQLKDIYKIVVEYCG